MSGYEKLHVIGRDDWRAWLRKNHDVKKEIWLIYYKKHTGKPRIPYNDAVEEAICFGWIDSTVKKIDEEKFVQKFTPRKARSKWSEANKKRALKMIEEARMTEAGLTKIREAKNTGEWFKTAPARKKLVVPSYLKEALAKNRRARDFFNSLASGYKRNFVGWIASAKKEETRQRRLIESIKLLEKSKKLGMK